MKLFKNFVVLTALVAGSAVAQDTVAPEVVTPVATIKEVKNAEAPVTKSVITEEPKKETCCAKEECKDAACKQGFLCAAVGAIAAVPALALTQIKAHPYIAGAVVLATAVAAVAIYNSTKPADKKRARRN